MERLPPFLCRAPDKDKDKSQSPGIACRDLKTPSKEKIRFSLEVGNFAGELLLNETARNGSLKDKKEIIRKVVHNVSKCVLAFSFRLNSPLSIPNPYVQLG
ncbi:hypothetical protein VNO77_05489 [Canavalia gladiata]|uniref:Uncharacterized protein n=1 Tax=Canavalia gladiata TaxID=3824 RepID=A0AAN9RA21_CANGL